MLNIHCQLKDHARDADGLVLMSPEQIDLWEERLARPVRACCLPSLPGPKRTRFDKKKRTEIRTRLGVCDRLVLVYVDNVITKWQRLEATCALVAQLAKKNHSVWFLALVRVDDILIAQAAMERHGLENRSTILHVSWEQIADYLLASDVGLFLRHVHPKNLVVTSSKFGEFLAAGLLIITTGANAEFLNEFIRDNEAGVFLSDSLPVDERLVSELSVLLQRSAQPRWRAWLSQRNAERFGGGNNPLHAYVSFIRKVLSQPRCSN